MELVIGWSTEYAQQKFSIGVDETDFAQIMAEQQIGEALAARVGFFDKFRLLEATARYLSEAESLRVITEGSLRDAAQARADKARGEIAACLKDIKVKLGLVAPDDKPAPPGD